MSLSSIKTRFISKSEVIAKGLYNSFHSYLSHVATICFLAAFIDDTFRLFSLWSQYTSQLQNYWQWGSLISNFIVFTFFISELGASTMIAFQKHIPLSCCVLFIVTLTQVGIYNVYRIFNIAEVYKYLALFGSLLLLLAEHQGNARKSYVGVPVLEETKTKSYLQLCGRCLILSIFFNVMKLGSTVSQTLVNIVGLVLITLVTVGFKTKLSALMLIAFLALFNCSQNSFWLYDEGYIRDFLKYRFFYILSVIGGLFVVVLQGPGEISVDENKKTW